MDVRITEQPLVDAKHTGQVMHRIVDKFYKDMRPWATLSIFEFFNEMKNIPFNPDPPGVELLKRPRFTMHRIGPGGDCDDKSIAIASWAKLNGIKYRFLGVGNKRPGQKYGLFDKILLTHVYPELYIGGRWIPFDATYSYNVLGQALHNYDRVEIL